MNDAKYIGLDVHQATISVAILDSAGKLVMEAILETKSATCAGHYCRGTHPWKLAELSHPRIQASRGEIAISTRIPLSVPPPTALMLSLKECP